MREVEKFERSKKIAITIGAILIGIVTFILMCPIVFWDKEKKGTGELIMTIIFMIALLIVISSIIIRMVRKELRNCDWEISNCQKRKVLFDLLNSKKENRVELELIDSSHLSTDEKNLYNERKGKFYARIISEKEVEVTAETEDGRPFMERVVTGDMSYFNKHYKVK